MLMHLSTWMDFSQSILSRALKSEDNGYSSKADTSLYSIPMLPTYGVWWLPYILINFESERVKQANRTHGLYIHCYFCTYSVIKKSP